MSPFLLSAAWDQFRAMYQFPAAGRIYENAPSTHPSWKGAMMGSTVGMANAAVERQQGRQVPPNTVVEALLSMRAAEHDYPLYWIDRSFWECLLRSDPPAEIALGDLHWPFPAMIFLLPRGTLVHETDGDCSWLMIGRLGGIHRCPLTGHQLEVRNRTVSVMTAPLDRPNPSTYTHGIPDEPEVRPFLPLPDYGGGRVDDYVLDDPGASPKRMTADDKTLCQVATQIGLRLILALSARPEILQARVAGKVVKGKDGLREFAAPRWIGHGYQIRVDGGQVGAGQVRMHWRRGHFKNQPHGEGRALRKLIWIEPYLAGGV